jgi:hypothetical protein
VSVCLCLLTSVYLNLHSCCYLCQFIDVLFRNSIAPIHRFIRLFSFVLIRFHSS